MTEKLAGRLLLVSLDGKKPLAVEGVPRVAGADQGGLLDVALGPDYATSKLVYSELLRAARGRQRAGGRARPLRRRRVAQARASRTSIFRMQPTLDSTKHAGGRLVFAPDGTLFITLGERSILEGRVQARDLTSDLGKIVRIRPDGTIPKTTRSSRRKAARPEIWTLGHRNVLGAALDAQQRLWVVEMGPRGGDELNLIDRARTTAGPPSATAKSTPASPSTRRRRRPGLEQPVYYWDPVISPGALTIYSGELVPRVERQLLHRRPVEPSAGAAGRERRPRGGRRAPAQQPRRAHSRGRARPRRRAVPADRWLERQAAQTHPLILPT